VREDLAIINTVDVFTPVVDDPYTFGQITAANSLSDVYAMGGQPVVALNVLAFHQGKFPEEIISRMMRGAQDKALEAGCVIGGGHSIQDTEIKYGLAVTGLVHPDKIWRNHTPQIGDVLVLTKPIGTGCMSTALKQEQLPEKDLERITKSMATLNREPVRILHEKGFDVHACTDITGYGLAGHLIEMLAEKQMQAKLQFDDLPLFPNTLDYIIEPAFLPGGFYANKLYAGDKVTFVNSVSEAQGSIVFDPQTSGGLLISMPEDQAKDFLKILRQNYSLEAGIIGRIKKGQDTKIVIS